MPALTAGELTWMRAHAEELLTGTCKIEYITHSRDAIGGDTPSWTARGTAIPCRLDAAQGQSISAIQGRQLHEGLSWSLTLKNGQAISLEDRVTIGGAVYRVTWVNDDDTERVLTRCTLARTAL